MPAKSEHKVMKHGTSGVVVIPKPYRDYHGLKPGSSVIDRSFLFDADMLSKIFERSIESSIRKIRLHHFTLKSTFWYAKMKLQILINSAIRHFKNRRR